MLKESMKKSAQYISLIPALAWMGLIFYMSAQPAEVSGDLSGSISHMVVQFVNSIFFCDWSEAKILLLAEQWDYPIRKLAHMTEFGILALLYLRALCMRMLYSQKRNVSENNSELNNLYLVAFGATVLYAATDELHQIFVPGRAGLITDILIDSLGALLALLAWSVLARVPGVVKNAGVDSTKA